MEQIIVWADTNKEWLFSGIGTTLLALLLGVLVKKKKALTMQQNSGSHSTNIQIGSYNKK